MSDDRDGIRMASQTSQRSGGERTAIVRTTHAAADIVADALAPDDTESMDVRVDDDAIECLIERRTTGGLRSTVDDYVVNLQVADRVIERARAHRDTNTSGGGRLRRDADTSDGDRPRTDANTSAESVSRTDDGDRPHADESNTHT